MEGVFNLVKVPLVLHGGTGIPKEGIKRAISLGTSKINVNTENQIAQAKKVREILLGEPDLYDARMYLGPGRDVIRKMREFGSSGKARVGDAWVS